MDSSYLCVFTGAGMDTESHLPDFRGPDGLWKNHDPRSLASTDALRDNYPLFHAFYSHRYENLKKADIHRGHQILAELEEKGLIKSIITQNISGLHQAAGSKKVIELHGSLKRFHCNRCNIEATAEDFLSQKPCICGGKLRPSLTLFGEALPQIAFRDAIEELEKADFLLILGTSLEVYPAAQLPFMFPLKLCYVGLEPVMQEKQMDYVFHTKIGDFLSALKEELDDYQD
jgi:NAD-dependent deacetylase